MSRRKKKFPCGHRGYGQLCHRCAQVRAEHEQKKQHKQEWEATFSEDPINLRNLPKNVVVKSRLVIEQLQLQSDYHQFHGKRLRHDRSIVSIPITRHYRLICRDCGQFLSPEAVISHEEYNVVKPGSL
jgi:hypothetical protein